MTEASPLYWTAAFVAVFLCVGVVIAEFVRTWPRQFDSFTIFLLIYFLQVLGPGAAIFTVLALSGAKKFQLNNAFFDHVYNSIDGYHALLVVAFGAVFLILAFLTYRVVATEARAATMPAQFRLEVSSPMLKFLVMLGLASGVTLILSFGDSVASGYRGLVRFRNLDPEITRTFVNANMFSLTQTFLLLGFLGLFLVRRRQILSPASVGWMAIIGALALFCVSRRSALIPALLVVFTLLLAGYRPKLWQFVTLGGVGVAVIFGGKQVLSFAGADVEEINMPVRDAASNVLYVASDIGITTTESLGTMALFDGPPRYGVDHALSILRRIPEGALGLDDPFPERIVRRSTEVFTNAEDQDIPPGFVGMMWVDFRWFGPLVYGLFWGVCLGLIERLRRRFLVNLQSSSVFALGLFVFCLPLNTGSLDFTFSVDIIALAVLVLFVLRVTPEREKTERSAGGAV